MSERALDRALELVAARAGLQLGTAGRRRLERSLLAAAEGSTLAEFVTRLEGDVATLDRIVESVTVQESAFFRDPMHFDALAEHVLPGLQGPVHVWSAGCANGQEPWSLAMLLAETTGDDFLVTATDLSADALAFAARGEYPQAMLRGLSEARRAQWLEPSGDGRMRIAARLRARVRFARHNLLREPLPLPRGACPIVFCRNVLIYAPRAESSAFLARVAAWLPPGGVLVLGASETLWAAQGSFTAEHHNGGYLYRPLVGRVGGGDSHAAQRRAPVDPSSTAGDGRRRAPVPVPAPPPVEPEVAPTVQEWLAEGERHAAAGAFEDAVTAFRKALFLAPDMPVTHARLGFALEAAGDAVGARRSFRAARAALAGAPDDVQAGLEGWDPRELDRVLADREADRA